MRVRVPAIFLYISTLKQIMQYKHYMLFRVRLINYWYFKFAARLGTVHTEQLGFPVRDSRRNYGNIGNIRSRRNGKLL